MGCLLLPCNINEINMLIQVISSAQAILEMSGRLRRSLQWIANLHSCLTGAVHRARPIFANRIGAAEPDKSLIIGIKTLHKLWILRILVAEFSGSLTIDS